MPRYDLPNAAPEPLRLVQLFVNTVDCVHGREWLPTPAALAGWLEERSLACGADVTMADLRRAIDLREALRSLLSANNGGAPAPDALATVNHSAGAAGLTLRLGGRGVEVTAHATGVEAPLGRILSVAFGAMLDGSWARLKSCRECRWAFYDLSRNRSASWCSMALCGNRLKGRAYRQRKTRRDLA